MVFIKATFQNTVRRFTAPDGINFEDIIGKLLEIFPELKGTAPESVALYYRDSDGDLVAVSSDEELHTAEQLVGEDKTLKLLVTVVNTPEEREDDEEVIDLLDHLQSLFNNHHPHPFSHQSLFGHNPFGSLLSFDIPSWTDRRRMLQQQEERLRRRREYEEKMRKAHLEHVKEIQERARKVEEERKRAAAEAKDKKGGEVDVKNGSKPVVPVFPPGWSVNPFGSWKPVVYQSPGGSTTCCVWGPWGYSACYGENTTDEMGKDEQTSETKKTEESKPEEAATVEATA